MAVELELPTRDSNSNGPMMSNDPKTGMTVWDEIWLSTDCMFSNRLTWLLVFGPVALIGSSFELLGEALCFAFAGLALVPCAERLSFITEQVALHTNGTVGALLNATFGNAPELLIAVAALRSGFYRLTQLTMLGSMITNMIFVFGVACLVGGLRWHVQDLRLTSGNVSVVMLLVSTAGSLIPAALILSGHFEKATTSTSSHHDNRRSSTEVLDTYPTQEEITLSRVNAAVMLILYLCFLVFQLKTHKDEFDDDAQYPPARPNLFCRNLCGQTPSSGLVHIFQSQSDAVPPATPPLRKKRSCESSTLDEEVEALLHLSLDDTSDSSARSELGASERSGSRMKRRIQLSPLLRKQASLRVRQNSSSHQSDKDKQSDPGIEEATIPVLGVRAGIFWLFIVTMCISAVSDVLVDTIDGFAQRMKLSQVFTSMVVIPFFSNVAEQVSAIIFAYRNKMDLCVGVTVGSAIQIATFVLPGAVLMAGVMDRSMTLYFHSYETVCWFFCTVVVASVLQNGTTNWLVGACLVGIYIMFAAGIWYHETENLSYDAETSDHD